MKTMKKILACALAVMLVLALTACGAKCAHCGQRVKGDGYKSNDKVFCDQNCADRAAFQDKLKEFVPTEKDDKEDKDDKDEEIPEEDDLPEEGRLPEEDPEDEIQHPEDDEIPEEGEI